MSVEDSNSKAVSFSSMAEKDTFLRVHDSQDSTETIVRRGGITNYHLIAYFFQQYLCQKLPKSVDVHGSLVCNVRVVFLRHNVQR